jgi:hypothetical protein
MSRIAFIAFFMAVMAALAQGCNNVDLNSAETLRLLAGGDGPVVCDPFGNGGAGATNGLEAKLTYLPSDSPVIAQGLSTASFGEGAQDVQVSPATLVLSQLNVGTRPFTEGFQVENTGAKLQTNSGEDLIEYFSVRARANLKLAPGESEGDYELALLSDDGSLLDLDPNGGSNYQPWITTNDGTHANKLGCSNSVLPMRQGREYPIRMHYYQGPRVRIALVMLWRLKNASTAAEPECDITRGDSYYFTPTATSASSPTANYDALLARGWKPIAPSNFILPDNKGNPCM